MVKDTRALPKAFAVRFATVKRWDPNSFYNIKWHWPSSYMVPIGSFLNLRKEKVDGNSNGFSDLMPVTIHFDGSIEPRKISEDKEYTMDLFWARPGDIVASKIDLKNGALAIVPNDWNKVVVTNHFAVYEPNLEKINPKYFHLLVQAKFFKSHLWRNKVGAEGRKEVKLNFFESLEIPVPPLPIQQKIVAYWEKATNIIESETARIDSVENGIPKKILDASGIKINPEQHLNRVFKKRFKDLERWGVEFNRYSWNLTNLITGSVYSCSPLSHFAWISPSTDTDLEDSDYVTFIPMEAVDDKNGVVSTAQVQQLKKVKSGYTRFAENDVLWAKITPCMQNGKSAIARNLKNGVGFGSTEFHVIRSKNKDILINEFIHLILRLPEIRQAAMRYFVGSAGQQRVPKDFLEGLYIPIPPLNIQIDLTNKVDIARVEIAKTRSSIKEQEILLKTKVEKMLVGTLPAEEL